MLVLDVQCFKSGKNTFIAKELAAYDGQRIAHYVFKAPFPLDHLPLKQQKEAHWVVNHHHQIPWDSGYTPLHRFADIVAQVTCFEDMVYVKGMEKAEYLQKFTKTPIIQLADQPAITADKPTCFYHKSIPSVCALSNVFFLYDFFKME